MAVVEKSIAHRDTVKLHGVGRIQGQAWRSTILSTIRLPKLIQTPCKLLVNCIW